MIGHHRFGGPKKKVPGKFLAVSLLTLNLQLATPSWGSQELTDAELRVVEALATNLPIEEAVGQLVVVGIPGDVNNYSKHKVLRAVARMGVGGFFGNKYNYYQEAEAGGQVKMEERGPERQLIYSFHNHLRALLKDSRLQVPPIIMCDFEGPRTTSFRTSAIFQPPPSLTLAATRDGRLVRDVGRYVGFELRHLGVDAMLGPVLDIDGTTQGKLNTLIGNRAFGATESLVYGAASHYATGLIESGILLFGKHFPGHGFIQGDPHRLEIPKFTGRVVNFERNLSPFRSLRSKLDGVLTAHVQLPFEQEYELATFSPRIIRDLIRSQDPVAVGGRELQPLGLDQELVLTDDLSNMGAVIKYKKKHSKTFGKIAVEAFAAGHDILLFSHIETERKKRGEFGEFSVKDLKSVLAELRSYVSSSPEAERLFRKSLKRIFIAKAKLLKLWGQSVDTLGTGEWMPPAPVVESLSTPYFLDGSEYRNGRGLLARVFAKAYTTVSSVRDFRPTNLSADGSKVMFFLSSSVVEKISESLPVAAEKRGVMALPRQKTEEVFEGFKGHIRRAVRDYDYIVISISSLDDANLLDFAFLVSRMEGSRAKPENIVGLLHTTPAILKAELLGSITVMGNFSSHRLAFESDIDYLRGLLEPNALEFNTVHLGERHIFFDADREAKHFLATPDVPEIKPIRYLTPREEGLIEDVEKLKAELQAATRQRLRAEEKLGRFWGYLKTCFRWSGFCLVLVGLLGLGQFILKSLQTIELRKEDKWWQTLARWVAHTADAKPWRLAVVALSLSCVVLGSVAFFEIRGDFIYKAIREKIVRLLDSEMESPQADLGGTAEGSGGS